MIHDLHKCPSYTKHTLIDSGTINMSFITLHVKKIFPNLQDKTKLSLMYITPLPVFSETSFNLMKIYIHQFFYALLI